MKDPKEELIRLDIVTSHIVRIFVFLVLMCGVSRERDISDVYQSNKCVGESTITVIIDKGLLKYRNKSFQLVLERQQC